MNLLLDTNTFIDYLGRKDPFFPPMRQIVAAAYFGDVSLWVPAQSATDAFYVMKKYVGSERVQKALMRSFEIIRPVSLMGEDLMQAVTLQWDDFEDCLVALCAGKARANYILTRDVKGFGRSLVPPISPQDWLDMMREEHSLSYDEIPW